MRWPMVPLGAIADIVGGSTPSRGVSEYWGGTIPWVTPTDLPMPGQGIAAVKNTDEKITEQGLASSAANLLPVGTVLFSSRATIGKLAINEVPVATNQGFANFIPGAVVYNRYLAWALQHHTVNIERLAGSTTFKEVTKTALKAFRIPMPPISEQRRIVEILDEAARLRKLRADADAKVSGLLLSLFLKTFGDPATNPKGWPKGSLGGFGNSVRYGLGQPPKAKESGLPVIRATNIHAGAIQHKNMIYADPEDVPPSRNAVLSSNEVIVVRSGAYTGDVAQVTEEWQGAVAGYDLVVSPAQGWTGEFLEQYLLTPFVQATYFSSQKSRAGQPHLNASQLEATPMYCPPPDLQEKFAACVREVRRVRTKTAASSEEMGRTFLVLAARAFSGQLTARWRELRMKDLSAEMEQQARILNLPPPTTERLVKRA